MNSPNSKRTEELLQKRSEHKLAITKLNQWLLDHINHPDRSKYFQDKGWHECELNRIDKKLHNLNANLPENGFSEDCELNNLNRNIINKTTS